MGKSLAKKSPKVKKASKESRFPKSYGAMIKECLTTVEDRKGLSAKGLQSWIKSTFNNEVKSKQFNKAVKSLVDKKSITKHKGHYLMTKSQKATPKDNSKKRRDIKKEKNKVKREKNKTEEKIKSSKKESKADEKKKNKKNK